jgi:hypothetical protein
MESAGDYRNPSASESIAQRSVETTVDVMDDGEEKDSAGAYSP